MKWQKVWISHVVFWITIWFQGSWVAILDSSTRICRQLFCVWKCSETKNNLYKKVDGYAFEHKKEGERAEKSYGRANSAHETETQKKMRVDIKDAREVVLTFMLSKPELAWLELEPVLFLWRGLTTVATVDGDWQCPSATRCCKCCCRSDDDDVLLLLVVHDEFPFTGDQCFLFGLFAIVRSTKNNIFIKTHSEQMKKTICNGHEIIFLLTVHLYH